MNVKFKEAYDIVVSELSEMKEVTGVLFFGSVQRGEETETSDLDFYATVSGKEGWNYKKIVKGIPVEIYFFPSNYWNNALQRNHQIMIAFAEGTVVLNRHIEINELCNKARSLFEKGPKSLTNLEINNWRIKLTELALDLEGISDNQSLESKVYIGIAVSEALQAYFAFNKMWYHKLGRIPESIINQDRVLSKLISDLSSSGENDIENIITLIDHILQSNGGRLEEYNGPRVSVEVDT
ncbi:nucleotidyltransferase domain-containing protein [Gracilibacillus sp. S3-1-1]|uniref:Nucleotidyltransferase domain-containing protein n=1 Tax=Gracilibacillus pellucidus TaxID=3095368 RepID=A0ACC6M5X0_9BACI|nr:nucleotidyltransferase domain-containing protein [Gracilibacillus sp. S3-1-1]MDX8046291.1 nucleotidyltransferase domain-containing protein [Gracilibacillus sp. S3-1-1]